MKGCQKAAQHRRCHHDADSKNGRTRESSEVFGDGLIAPYDFLLFVDGGGQPIEEAWNDE